MRSPGGADQRSAPRVQRREDSGLAAGMKHNQHREASTPTAQEQEHVRCCICNTWNSVGLIALNTSFE